MQSYLAFIILNAGFQAGQRSVATVNSLFHGLTAYVIPASEKKKFFLFFFLFMTDGHTLVFAGTFREQFWFFSELRINKSKITASHRHSGYILQNSSNTPVCYNSLDIVSFPSFITLLDLKKDGFPKCDELSQSHRHYMIWNSCMPEYSGTAKFISCNVKAEKHNLSEIKLLTM